MNVYYPIYEDKLLSQLKNIQVFEYKLTTIALNWTDAK